MQLANNTKITESLIKSTRNWCHICEKEFQLKSEEQKVCPICKQCAFEEISPESDPSQYHAYQTSISNQQPVSNSSPSLQQRSSNGNANPLVGLMSIFSGLDQQQMQLQRQLTESNSDNPQRQAFQMMLSRFTQQLPQISNQTNQLINYFLQNLSISGQPYRGATQAQIDALKKVDHPQECAVCQLQDDTGQGYKLKCGHQFHSECLKKWFQVANTCPTCREPL